MELVNTNGDDSFDPTPRLESSPIPIKFIPFNFLEENCGYCGEKYIEALFCWNQKYCEKCLSSYNNGITDNNIYLDIYYIMGLECNEHEISRTEVPQNIQECRANYWKILCFKQINGYTIESRRHYYIECARINESENDCKLCGKSLYQGTDEYTMEKLKLCSDCYLISSGLIKSTLVNRQISILYLPWWHNDCSCKVCNSRLASTSDCQKYCTNCYIFYIGCRYCLTTNIIFGPTSYSQCKKCKRITLIINSSDIDDCLLYNVILDKLDKLKIQVMYENTVKNIDKYFNSWSILGSILKKNDRILKQIKWIPYSQFEDVKEMTKGGYGTIYKATWSEYPRWESKISGNKTVILKRFENSKNNGKYFLNELKAFEYCFNNKYDHRIIETYGFTKDPESEDYILVIKYASEGDLHKYLQKNFINITWNKQKLLILWQISKGLECIHINKFVHRDFHSGNILFDFFNGDWNYQWKITDLGLSQAVNNKSSNNEIYGVIPYIAPEIFKGSDFSKEADIYSLSMIMWELTTGRKPFDNVEHDIHLIYKILEGERPKITEDTPQCYANLMKSCWDPDPKKRPTIKEIRFTFERWTFRGRNKIEFNQAEKKRKELLQLKKIGPEFAENRHSEAIYTSRPLSAFISKCSSINSIISQGYKTRELEFDIDFERSSSQNIKKRSNDSRSLNDETYDNSGGKRIKTRSNNDP
ncbi:hypothetical protein RclHR1_02220005 [Rhizophagus clarus]|uniref:Kinase-like domain-containing protein n=1 Tax=Rhizophagus clarus TaxID=94130 RepID=A0A2Z6QUQ4_9GLOM|nr:hypothetical protein RclHR1_02220005 [Rhizophagus clarus]GES81802.1 kinase-like domain-containing protein [Rhizophagus clarus]